MNATKEVFLNSAKACVENGNRLLGDAEMLEYSEPPATTFALAIIAQEEFAKGYLLVLAAREVIPWLPLIWRASRDHVCKQLLGIVIEYMSPDIDEGLIRSEEWLKQNNEMKGLLTSLEGDLLNRNLWRRLGEIKVLVDGLPSSVTALTRLPAR